MSDIYATKLKQDLHGDILISNGGVSAEENTFIKVGSAAPKYNLGFRNSFSWKGVELDFLIDARVGGEVISATQALMESWMQNNIMVPLLPEKQVYWRIMCTVRLMFVYVKCHYHICFRQSGSEKN